MIRRPFPWTRLADPTTAIAGTVSEFQFTSDEIVVYCAHFNSPFISSYETSSVPLGERSRSIGRYPLAIPLGAAISRDDSSYTMPLGNNAGVTNYEILSIPAVQGLAVVNNPAVTIGSLEALPTNDIVIAAANSGTTLYGWNTTADPTAVSWPEVTVTADIPVGTGVADLRINQDESRVAIGGSSSPFLKIYDATIGASVSLTAITDPSTLPTATVNALNWKGDGTMLAVTDLFGAGLIVYDTTSVPFTALTLPTTPSLALNCAFSDRVVKVPPV